MSDAEQASEETPESEADSGLTVRDLMVRRGAFRVLVIPALAVLTALILGAFVIIATDDEVVGAWGRVGQNPLGAISATVQSVTTAYLALFQGSFGSPGAIINGLTVFLQSGESRPILAALRPLGESLTTSIPFMFAGLAVALGFRGGLFNIGAEGQLFVGGLASVWVGYSLTGLPWIIHLPLALIAGALAGAAWGAIPGFLKARTGAHEVINTIMMNWIAFRLADFLLSGPMSSTGVMPVTPDVLPSAILPALLPRPVRVHAGIFLALLAAGFVFWFLWRTTRGFEIRTAGANPRAARYAGINITRTIVLTMGVSGALAGLAGATQVLGVNHRMVRAFSSGYGFDAIALALLGNSHPVGVVLASFLFGFLAAGSARMQSVAGVPVEIIRIVQGLIIIFIAAPEIVRRLYRLRAVRKEEELVLTRGWGA